MKKELILAGSVFLLSFGCGRYILSKASTNILPVFYHPNLLGYTVPKALRGIWYFGKNRSVANSHHFDGNYYHRGKVNKYMISRHLVSMSWTLGIDGPKYKSRGFFDGVMVPDIPSKPKKLIWDFNEEYTPVIFEYQGHLHKEIDISGQAPDSLITRKPTRRHLAFNSWKDNGWGKNTKVKLVKIGW